MITQKLLNNNININIVHKMIEISTKTYNEKLNLDMTNMNNRNSLLAFISDDTYEFDCISKFAKTMIDNNIDSEKWEQISLSIKNYNNIVENNTLVYSVLKNLIKYYKKNDHEYIFIDKITTHYSKKCIGHNDQKLSELNKKISLIENKFHSDIHNNTKVHIDICEMNGIQNDMGAQFYNKITKRYELPLSYHTLNPYLKAFTSSNTRGKLCDTFYNNIADKIPRLMYLLIYKHVKANILGYNSYFEYISPYNSENIRNILENMIIRTRERCDIELGILTHMKKQFEHDDNLNFWDIDFYINKWKSIFGIDDLFISQYFESTNTIKSIMTIIEKLYPYNFVECNKQFYYKNNYSMIIFDVYKDNVNVGSVIFDLSERTNKMRKNRIICLNNNCFYPFEQHTKQPCVMLVSMSLGKSYNGKSFFDTTNLTSLFNIFGQLLYFLSCDTNYNLFGSMYSYQEKVNTFGKFMELILSEHGIIRFISNHYNTHEKLDDKIISKIVQQKKLDFGIVYRYQCLLGLYDLYVHTQFAFINECKNLMKINNFDKQKNDIIQYMNDLYNKFYDAIYNSGNIKIFKNDKHFHPIIWTYMYGDNECYTFTKIISDICGHMIYEQYSKVKSKNNFCSDIIDKIALMTHDKYLNIEKILPSKISIEPIMNYYNINDCNEEYMSLYQINNVIDKKDNREKTKRMEKDEYYKSPINDSELESDESIKRILGKIVYH